MDEASSSSSSLLRKEASSLPHTMRVEDILPCSLPRQWLNFRRSGPPVKVGIILQDWQISFPQRPLSPLAIDMLAAKKTPILEFVDDSGGRFLCDLLRLVCVEFDDGGAPKRTAGICWVDKGGNFFSPGRFGGVDEASVTRDFHSSSRGLVAITAVHPCRHREARVLGFLDKMKEVHASWVFGWYGGPAGDVETAAQGGEVRTNWELIGAERAHGRGIHISAADQQIPGAMLSGTGTGARVLYCALAPGSREVVPAGSLQSQPSSSFFYSGTDSLPQSSWYVFWEDSSSILPLYAVSFGYPKEAVQAHQLIPKRSAEQALPSKKRRRADDD